MSGLDTLRELYPWPATRPPFLARHGWFRAANARALARVLSGFQAPIVLEVGSWFGESALFIMAEHARARLVALDTWLGSAEHILDAATRPLVPRLHDGFLSNLWEHRARVVPVRLDSVNGMRLVRALGIEPAVVYVDGNHDELAVTVDLRTARECFPRAVLVGDDWQLPGVRSAVEAVLGREHGERVSVDEGAWWTTA